jgi:hypothetical protein
MDFDKVLKESTERMQNLIRSTVKDPAKLRELEDMLKESSNLARADFESSSMESDSKIEEARKLLMIKSGSVTDLNQILVKSLSEQNSLLKLITGARPEEHQ